MSIPLNQESQVMIELQDLNIKEDEEQKQRQAEIVRQNNQKKEQKPSNSNNGNNNPPANRPNNLGNNNSQQQQPNRGNQPQNNNTMPHIPATCKFCTLDQKIAGNAQLFVCAACENMNECLPKYNVFICCKCRRNVTYPLGVSNLIKCNACKTVNKVPVSIGQSSQNYQYAPQQPVVIRVPQNAQTNVRISNTNRNTYANNNSYPYQQPSYQQPNNNFPQQQQQQVWQNYQDFFKNQPKQEQQNLQAGQFIYSEPQKQQSEYPNLQQLTIVNQNKDGVSSQKIILNGQTIVDNKRPN